MPRIVCISDTHLVHEETRLNIPDGDILLHAGDATYRGSNFEIGKFAIWFASLPHKHKVFVSGNHDFGFQRNNKKAVDILKGLDSEFYPNPTDNGVIYLQDSGVELEGLKIWGSPWQPWFYDWAFNLERGAEIKAKWDLIPAGTDIVITHGPPYGYGDKVPSGELVGCADLLDALKRIKPKLHVCGHIHLGHGLYNMPEGTIIANSSICDERYKGVNAPHVIDL